MQANSKRKTVFNVETVDVSQAGLKDADGDSAVLGDRTEEPCSGSLLSTRNWAYRAIASPIPEPQLPNSRNPELC